MTEIQRRLFENQDPGYREFHSRLMPGIDPGTVIGVRIPVLRALAKELAGTETAAEFLRTLPHSYYEENNLHDFFIGMERDFETCIDLVEDFLPYVDNWATCDSLRPKCFGRHRGDLLPHIRRWLGSERSYTVRFAMEMLMVHYLDENFAPEYLGLAAGVVSGEYYVNMMAAWYFATALAKHWEETLPYLTEGKLSPWVHNKTVQKAIESCRITGEQKLYLKTIKRSCTPPQTEKP